MSRLAQVVHDVQHMALDDSGNLYYSAGSGGVMKLNLETNIITVVCTTRISVGSLVWLEGYLYACQGGAIMRWKAVAGNVLYSRQEQVWKSGFSPQMSINVDTKGDIVVAAGSSVLGINTETGKVYKIISKSEAFTKRTNQFVRLRKCVATSDGTFYVVDEGSIQKIKQGKITTIVSAQTAEVSDIVLLDNKTLLVSSRRLGMFNVNLETERISNFQGITGDQVFTKGPTGRTYIFDNRTHSLYLLVECWATERLLWIGNRKEHPSWCYLAGVPKEIIRLVLGQLYSSQQTVFDAVTMPITTNPGWEIQPYIC